MATFIGFIFQPSHTKFQLFFNPWGVAVYVMLRWRFIYLFLHPSLLFLYRNGIYKINLKDKLKEKAVPQGNLQNRPDFGKEGTQVNTDWDTNSDTYKLMHDYLTR